MINLLKELHKLGVEYKSSKDTQQAQWSNDVAFLNVAREKTADDRHLTTVIFAVGPENDEETGLHINFGFKTP